MAVTGVPDSRKGERLVVVHTGLGKPVTQVIQELAQAGLPPLWIPSPNSFIQVEELPLLGTGKLDLRKLKQIAAGASTDTSPQESRE
jgi:acyl-[acyl-carrier-protein]-phospholipid O-acyltransferase/long-chain-fatty-acid--[acyl-carrier-protein] ligase